MSRIHPNLEFDPVQVSTVANVPNKATDEDIGSQKRASENWTRASNRASLALSWSSLTGGRSDHTTWIQAEQRALECLKDDRKKGLGTDHYLGPDFISRQWMKLGLPFKTPASVLLIAVGICNVVVGGFLLPPSLGFSMVYQSGAILLWSNITAKALCFHGHSSRFGSDTCVYYHVLRMISGEDRKQYLSKLQVLKVYACLVPESRSFVLFYGFICSHVAVYGLKMSELSAPEHVLFWTHLCCAFYAPQIMVTPHFYAFSRLLKKCIHEFELWEDCPITQMIDERGRTAVEVNFSACYENYQVMPCAL